MGLTIGDKLHKRLDQIANQTGSQGATIAAGKLDLYNVGMQTKRERTWRGGRTPTV